MARSTTRQLQRKRNNRKSRPGQKTGLQPGDVLQERYRIVGPLGAGGFSSVYQARDMRFPGVTKLCAIKEMLISASDPQMRELTIKSFEREAGMLAMLDHPTIPDISDYFTERNRSYLVLELIRGKDLDQWLQDETEFIKEETAVEWGIQVCEALAYLHSQKPQPIVFRDMKPSNIMLDQHQRIRLIDFGIAKLFESDQKGTMIGTEGYSPPEQYRGIASPAGDVYALGATLHHLLTRQDPRLEPPFTFAERPIRKVNPQISENLEAVVNRCLVYNPKERYPNAMALKEALENLSQQQAQVSPQQMAPVAVTLPQGQAAPATTAQVEAAAHVAIPQIKPIWTFKCEDEVRRKATVDGSVLYIGAYDNNLYALSRSSGEFLWKFPTQDSIGTTPFVAGEDVYITSTDSYLYSIEKETGKQKWRFGTEQPIYSSPIARFDHIFFGSDDNTFYAVNAGNGKLRWKANAFSPVRSTAHVDDESVFFGTEGGYIYSLEITTGKMRWQTQAKRAVTSSPAYADDIIFIGSVDTTVYAIDATSGFTIWRFRSRRPIISSPVVYDNTVYIGSSDGNLYAIDMNSGRQIWAYEVDGQIASSPAAGDGAIYFGATDGCVYSLSAKKGELRWRFDTGAPVIASPIVVDEMVYIGSNDKNVYALPI